MMLLYRALYLPGLLLALPYYVYRMWRRGGYSRGFSNRFGLMGNIPQKCNNVKRIWIQAVSVGELLAIRPLLMELKKDSGFEVVLTTTTSTGLRVLEGNLSKLVDGHGVFPMDFWPCSRAAWNSIDPDMAILMEGELWPEHIHQAKSRNVPVILANARLSDRSFARHFRFRKLARPYFNKLSVILAGSETDRDRLLSLDWVPADKIRMTGNLKLDVPVPGEPSPGEKSAALAEFGMPPDTILLLGSSTWPGEESLLLDCYRSLVFANPSLRLLIVPRHAERRPELQSIMDESGLAFHFRSDSPQAPGGTEVYVADTTGELGQLTRFADIVFIGKSLPPNTGGQTPVEAAAAGKPLIFGPDMSNFRDISKELIRSGTAIRVSSADELEDVIRQLLASGDKRQQMGKSAQTVIQASRGATDRHLQEIRQLLDS